MNRPASLHQYSLLLDVTDRWQRRATTLTSLSVEEHVEEGSVLVD
jgi:hypothetical protein